MKPLSTVGGFMITGDVYWLAGLLEGEGSFMFARTTPCISVQMIDLDIIERAACIMGDHVRVRGPYQPKYEGSKQTYVAALYGTHAHDWMIKLRPLMGVRRQQQIDSVLEKRAGFVAQIKRTLPPTCHPDRRAKAIGLCGPCYRRHLYSKYPERYREYNKKAYEKRKALGMNDFDGSAGVLTLA